MRRWRGLPCTRHCLRHAALPGKTIFTRMVRKCRHTLLDRLGVRQVRRRPSALSDGQHLYQSGLYAPPPGSAGSPLHRIFLWIQGKRLNPPRSIPAPRKHRNRAASAGNQFRQKLTFRLLTTHSCVFRKKVLIFPGERGIINCFCPWAKGQYSLPTHPGVSNP